MEKINLDEFIVFEEPKNATGWGMPESEESYWKRTNPLTDRVRWIASGKGMKARSSCVIEINGTDAIIKDFSGRTATGNYYTFPNFGSEIEFYSKVAKAHGAKTLNAT